MEAVSPAAAWGSTGARSRLHRPCRHTRPPVAAVKHAYARAHEPSCRQHTYVRARVRRWRRRGQVVRRRAGWFAGRAEWGCAHIKARSAAARPPAIAPRSSSSFSSLLLPPPPPTPSPVAHGRARARGCGARCCGDGWRWRASRGWP